MAALVGTVLAALPASGPASAQAWRSLCVKGTPVEFSIGSTWYDGIVLGPNQGEESCAITNTSFAGSEKIFNMTPDRFRAAGSVPGAEVFPKVADPRCVPGTRVELKIGSSWYEGTVVQPHPTDGSCGIRNTTYSGREMVFAAESDRYRIPADEAPRPAAASPIPGAAPGAAPGAVVQPVTPPPATPPLQPAARPRVIDVVATVEEIGDAYAGNTPAARAKYEKKTVQLTGTLQRVTDDTIILNDGPFGKAMCTFAPQDRAQLATLQPGSTVTVVGEESWWGWDWFNLKRCAVVQASAPRGPVAPPDAATGPATGPATDGGPPAGRYVCRQSMTTMGYMTLGPDGRYDVSNVEGRYRHHADTGEVEWLSGSYADWGWKARYDHRSAASLGRPQDEHIIRMTDDRGTLRIDCFLMRD